ncbi:hypothetical protein V1283_001923 [Bradyrhizobium sp. AZCC 2262]|uniref:hypothetical protein n=1 Tax=Bradyrhizobium sp. AZCC 2262 TaxID=3117022 RepID=UPI002FF254B7
MTVAATYSPRRIDIMSASSEMLGLSMLQADPHGWRLDGATQLAAVRDALADGEATAKELHVRFSGLAPQGIAQAFRVPIEVSNDDPMVGTLWRLAEYQQRPPRILLYSRGLALLERTMVGPLAEKLLGRANLRDIFLAHELFHHLEAIRTDQPISQRYQPTLFRIGRWRWRTGIAALAEIAAGAFSQALLGLPCHPRVLDLVVIDAISPNAVPTRPTGSHISPMRN